MTFKELKQKIKEEQKILAQTIIRGKFLRKPCNCNDITDDDKRLYFWSSDTKIYYNQYKVERLSNKYRHRHIVYCQMFNNTPYDKIEQPREDNSPNSDLLEKIKNEWEVQLDEETLCDCA